MIGSPIKLSNNLGYSCGGGGGYPQLALLLLDELGEELLEAGRHDAPVPREVQVEPLGNLVHVQTEIEIQEIAVFVNPAGPIL